MIRNLRDTLFNMSLLPDPNVVEPRDDTVIQTLNNIIVHYSQMFLFPVNDEILDNKLINKNSIKENVDWFENGF